MSGAEIKVVLYEVRRTYGFRRTSDRMSVAQMSMGQGSFSTTMKYYTGVPQTSRRWPRRLSESRFSESRTGQRWTLLPSNPERLAELKAELQEKLLQNVGLCSALGRTRTCDLLIRSQTSHVLACPAEYQFVP
jgi:hypothetical protein